MEASLKAITTERKDLVNLLISSILIMQFLFLIDEGYNDFRWMQKFGNWVVFVIYTSLLFGVQLLIYYFLPFRTHRFGKVLISVALGLAATLILINSIFWDEGKLLIQDRFANKYLRIM